MDHNAGTTVVPRHQFSITFVTQPRGRVGDFEKNNASHHVDARFSEHLWVGKAIPSIEPETVDRLHQRFGSASTTLHRALMEIDGVKSVVLYAHIARFVLDTRSLQAFNKVLEQIAQAIALFKRLKIEDIAIQQDCPASA